MTEQAQWEANGNLERGGQSLCQTWSLRIRNPSSPTMSLVGLEMRAFSVQIDLHWVHSQKTEKIPQNQQLRIFQCLIYLPMEKVLYILLSLHSFT